MKYTQDVVSEPMFHVPFSMPADFWAISPSQDESKVIVDKLLCVVVKRFFENWAVMLNGSGGSGGTSVPSFALFDCSHLKIDGLIEEISTVMDRSSRLRTLTMVTTIPAC